MTEDLHSLRDDMVAFIEGHGLRRFGALVDEELPSVLWSDDKPDAWKDVVELAKASNAAFVTLHSITLKKEDLEYLVERLRNGQYPNDDDIEEARLLRLYAGKVGYIQIGFPSNGIMFLFEISTKWYERYESLTDVADEFGSFMFDENDKEED